ncbi:DUF6086 family protein [Micromonospora sp. NPDC049275]|uniref:DUF6086 family protein n=1 Tax=Micromonospora sp. NPDC049275 TaxID=3364268 RepID=UPI00371E87D9
MSQCFSVHGIDVWDVATTVAQLFYQTAGAMVVVTGRPHGIRDLERDEYDVDLPTYQEFVGELTRRYLEGRHRVLVPLIEGFLPTALALLRKAGGDVPLLAETAARDPKKARDLRDGRSDITQAKRLLALADGLATSISA